MFTHKHAIAATTMYNRAYGGTISDRFLRQPAYLKRKKGAITSNYLILRRCIRSIYLVEMGEGYETAERLFPLIYCFAVTIPNREQPILLVTLKIVIAAVQHARVVGERNFRGRESET